MGGMYSLNEPDKIARRIELHPPPGRATSTVNSVVTLNA